MRVAAGVAHNDDTVIEVTRGIYRRCDPDVHRSARNDQSIDAARAKRQVKIGLMKRAPAIFGDDVIFGSRCDLLDDFLLPQSSSGAVLSRIAVIVGPRPKAHICVSNHDAPTLAVRSEEHTSE